jgi:urease accessory protein UreH
MLADTRAVLADTGGHGSATLVNGLLVARFLAESAQNLRRDLARLWCTLRQKAGNLPPVLPRTWYT